MLHPDQYTLLLIRSNCSDPGQVSIHSTALCHVDIVFMTATGKGRLEFIACFVSRGCISEVPVMFRFSASIMYSTYLYLASIGISVMGVLLFLPYPLHYLLRLLLSSSFKMTHFPRLELKLIEDDILVWYTGAMQSYTWSLTYTVTTAAGSPAENSQQLPCMRSPHVPSSSVTHRIPVYPHREEHG